MSAGDPPTMADEATTVVAFIEVMRDAVWRKAEGLDDAQLDTTLPPSTMTLGGLLHHLAYVEDYWFGVVLTGRPPTPPWENVDWATDHDWDWHAAATMTGDEIRARWTATVEESRRLLTDALERGLDTTGRTGNGTEVSLRYVLVHLVEEYARHAGHADLIRESIDGLVGE